jgi:peptidoglycan/xylan/chitin deacetylase (PgdA/CDA1 family)
VVLTLDDGFMCHAKVALPRLAKLGMRAIFFICPGKLNTPGYLDRAALLDLTRAGMEIGSHGMNHVDWRSLDKPGEVLEYDGARQRLEDICGKRVSKAALPYGGYNRRVLNSLWTRPFQHVYSCDRGLAKSTDWLKTRNTIEAATTEQELDDLFDGRTPWTAVLRRHTSTVYKSLR